MAMQCKSYIKAVSYMVPEKGLDMRYMHGYCTAIFEGEGHMKKTVKKARSILACCEEIYKVMRRNKVGRATLSSEYFRELVDRSRIEDAFLSSFNKIAIQEFDFAVMRVSRTKYMSFRTTDKFVDEDPYKPEDE
jgi:predicted transglutaminase-like protease